MKMLSRNLSQERVFYKAHHLMDMRYRRSFLTRNRAPLVDHPLRHLKDFLFANLEINYHPYAHHGNFERSIFLSEKILSVFMLEDIPRNCVKMTLFL